MGLFVPLGDMFERRALIVWVCLALASHFACNSRCAEFCAAGLCELLFRVTCIIPHLILPFAAQLSPPASRGKTWGTVVSGLLIGILCARTFSGFVGAAFGWRSVYFVGAAIMVVLAVVLWRYLPRAILRQAWLTPNSCAR